MIGGWRVLHLADHRAVEDIQRREQRRAMANINACPPTQETKIKN
jgi:hypothetical protein